MRVRLLLEITAGQGSCLGCRFDDMAEMLERARGGDTMGICFDTCHAHASGIDLSTEEGYERAFDDFARTIGIDRLRAFHLNDSKTPAGSRVDRHAEIGDGYLGLLPFWRLVNDARFASVPGVLETPHGPDKLPSFARNLARLRALVGAPRPPGPPKSQALPEQSRPASGAAVRRLAAVARSATVRLFLQSPPMVAQLAVMQDCTVAQVVSASRCIETQVPNGVVQVRPAFVDRVARDVRLARGGLRWRGSSSRRVARPGQSASPPPPPPVPTAPAAPPPPPARGARAAARAAEGATRPAPAARAAPSTRDQQADQGKEGHGAGRAHRCKIILSSVTRKSRTSRRAEIDPEESTARGRSPCRRVDRALRRRRSRCRQ